MPLAVSEMTHDAINTPLLALIPSSAHRILDVGCGSGTFGASLKKEYGADREVTGITVSPPEAELARERLDAVHLLDLNDKHSVLPSGPFDCIVCSHVLGYFYQPETVLQRLRGLLTPKSGVLIAAIPNVVQWNQRLKFLKGSFEYTDSGVLHRHYMRFFDRAGAHACLRDSGFEILQIEDDGYFPLPGLRRIAPRLAQRLDRWAIKANPTLLASQFILVARPKVST